MSDVVLARPPRLCESVVIIDGIGGCGKTMLSAIIASFDRVELLKYAYEIEQYSIMQYFGLLDMNSASQMIRYQLDLTMYNVMMGRDVNFRFSDLSSVFNAQRKMRYLKRIFAKGDEVVPARIRSEKPILHVATHGMSAYVRPILLGGPEGLLFINMHRHPLFMLKQNTWNMEHLINSQRHFSLYYKWKDGAVPFYFAGREELLSNASPKEKAIYYIEWVRRRAIEATAEADPRRYYELTFESLVEDPNSYLDEICNRLRTARSSSTARVLKREKIPRTLLTDGRVRSIYRRVGWTKTQSRTRESELDTMRQWAYEGLSVTAKDALDWLCADYDALAHRLDRNP